MVIESDLRTIACVPHQTNSWVARLAVVEATHRQTRAYCHRWPYPNRFPWLRRVESLFARETKGCSVQETTSSS